MEPDEIINPEGIQPVAAPEAQLLVEIQRLYQSGSLDNIIPKRETLPVFVLGAIGGAIGARVLKGTAGIFIGGLAALWAIQRLNAK